MDDLNIRATAQGGGGITRAALLSLILLAGCEDAVQSRQIILAEVHTGCQYIGRQATNMVSGDLKPLLDEQGKQICNRPTAG